MKKIRVWKRYAGNRAKRPIELGDYDAASRKLFGLARYLIDNGNAVEVIEEAPVLEGVSEAIQTPIIKVLEAAELEVKKPAKRAKGKS